jgi:hypothetical protein
VCATAPAPVLCSCCCFTAAAQITRQQVHLSRLPDDQTERVSLLAWLASICTYARSCCWMRMMIHALASPFFSFLFFGCANNLLTPGLGWAGGLRIFSQQKTVLFYLSRVVAFALLLMPVLSEQRRQLTVFQKSEPKEFSLIFNTHVICVATAQRMFHFFRTRSKETCQKCCVITRSGKVRRCHDAEK